MGRMASMKHQYENKLLELNNRIHHTQEERDKVLKNMGGKTVVPDQINKIKKDYQEKLDKLQGEVKKLQAAKKEHAKLLKSQGQYEKQLTKLKTDVLDMKRTKVKLVQKMKEETNRHRELEIRKNREVATLKKEGRKNESKIKSLETEKRLKEIHWICGLTFLPGGNIVVSGCRAGTIKLWSAETCNLIGEMKAHNSTINTIATNYSHIFTASNDGSIGMWRLRSNYDRSPDSESS